MKNSTKGILMLVASAFLYSIMPVLIRLLGAGRIPPMSQVFLRYIFAFLSALLYFIVTKSKNEIKVKDIFFILLLAVFGYALTNLFFTYGIIFTQVSTALFIFYCFGIITPILGFIFLKEKMNAFNIFALALGIIALLLLFSPGSVTTWKLGAIFAFASALGQSFYLIGRKILHKYSSKFLLLCCTFIGIIVLGIMSFIFEHEFYFSINGIQTVTLATWITTILFGIDNFTAWLLMSKGFQLVNTSTGSMTLLIENIFALLLAFLFFQEVPTIMTCIGGVLILSASVVVIFKGKNS